MSTRTQNMTTYPNEKPARHGAGHNHKEMQMDTKRKIEIGKVFSAKVGGSWLPVRIDKSLGHGRYEGASLPSGHAVKISTDAIRGDGQTVEQWKASTTPKEHDLPAPAKGAAAEPAKTKTARKERTPKGPRHSLANAAILVLSKAKEPMSAKAIVEQATADKLYTPGDGRTPDATLYSAMMRDKKARFERVDRQVDGKTQRGLWTLTAAGKAEIETIRQAFAAKKDA